MENEKKFTDEEIVKVLDKCFAKCGEMSCDECKLFDGTGLRLCMRNVAVETLDLIQMQKAEIERLKKGQAESAKTAVEALEQNIELRKQVNKLKTEIERLSIKVWNYEQPARTPLYGNESMVNCNFVTCYNENADLKAKNAELQKQVDELKAENTELYKEHTTLIAGSIFQKEQTIKDTAKDLLIDFNEWINGQHDEKLDAYSVHIPVHEVTNFLTDKAKEYGVEVEMI